MLLLSNITLACGTKLDPAMYAGDQVSAHSTSNHLKVNQNMPNDKTWSLWRKLLHTICMNHSQHHALKEPLGPWLLPPSQLRRQWHFFYDPPTDSIYHNTSLGPTQHMRLRHDFDQTPHSIENAIPDTAVPAKVKHRPETWTLLRWSANAYTPPASAPTTMLLAIPTMSPWEQALLEQVHFFSTETEVWRQLCTKSCIIASDGSAPGPTGSFAWIISDLQGN
jgi:hypothetical protein